MKSIIGKFLSGSASTGESQELMEWLKESKENRKYYFSIKRIWLAADESRENKDLVDDSWERLKLRTVLSGNKTLKRNGKIKNTLKKVSIAASVLLIIGLSAFLALKLNITSGFDQTVHEITVPFGSRTTISLPDGTKVWLNAGSTLTYTSDFGRRNRNVTLSGEAFFDVNPSHDMVFIVNTDDMNVKVLGTQFNVKSYPEDKVAETTLITGEVEVDVIHESKIFNPVVLLPKQKMTYSREADTVVLKQEKDNDELASWREGRLSFRSVSLDNIARELERFYNVQITFQDDNIKKLTFSGTLEEVTIEEVLKAVASASSISYTKEKNKIFLSN